MTTQSPTSPVRVVGGYAAAPDDQGARREFFAAVLADPRSDGLEIPFGSAGYEADASWLWTSLPAGSRHVLTLVAGTMERLAADPRFGLASVDEAGRRAAVDLAAAARRLVGKVNAAGHARIVAVEVQSAPAAHDLAAAEAALTESLHELAGWDWQGAAISVEHCDAVRPDGIRAKGFLPLAAELRAVAEAGRDTATRLGVSLNWGRSVIERRDPVGSIEHAREARTAGVLLGQVFSGTSDRETDFGPAWCDAHHPLATDSPLTGAAESLLTRDQLILARRAGGPDLIFDGVKISVRPATAGVGQRLATIGAALDALGEA